MTRRQPEPAETTPAKPKRQRSDGALAGALYERIQAINVEEQAELAASPAEIRAKHQARRDKALSGASNEVRALVGKMLGEDDAPRSE